MFLKVSNLNVDFILIFSFKKVIQFLGFFSSRDKD